MNFCKWLFLLFLLTPLLQSAEQVFEVLAPEKLPFSYPDPPKEGAPDFFAIATDGAASCAIVYSENASPSLQAAVREFAAYLKLSTGAAFQVLPETRAVPDGLGAIHVGETKVARSVELALPTLRYGEDEFEKKYGALEGVEALVHVWNSPSRTFRWTV